MASKQTEGRSVNGDCQEESDKGEVVTQKDDEGSQVKEVDMKWYYDKKTGQIIFGDANSVEPDPEEQKDLLLHRIKVMDVGPPPVKELQTLDLDGVAAYIKSDKCKNIITMAGAGISTSAGFPDFRTPGTGLYDNLQKYDIPYPQAIFDLEFFQKSPEPFFALAKELWPGVFKPTPCHYFIKMLADKGLLLRHYTQNIDTLESQVGLKEEKLVEAHGSFRTAHCLVCKKEYSQDSIAGRVLSGVVPQCEEQDCDGTIKPDIVFIGETLSERFVECVEKDFGNCDLLVILGTSLVVQPFASLTHRVPVNTPRLYINLENTGAAGAGGFFVFFGGGFKFDDKDNYRDVFWQATCDDGCLTLAEKLGWKAELTRMIKREHAKLDKTLVLNAAKTKHLQGKESVSMVAKQPGKVGLHSDSSRSEKKIVKGKASL